MRAISIFCVASTAATGVLLVAMGSPVMGAAVLMVTAVLHRAFKSEATRAAIFQGYSRRPWKVRRRRCRTRR